MRPFKAGAAVVLSMALVMPMAAVAEEPAADSLVMQDAAGDLYDLFTDELLAGPDYVDITGVAVSVGADHLTVGFDVAGDVPAELDPAYTTVGYLLAIDTDDDGLPNYHIDIGSENGWAVNLATYDPPSGTLLGEAVVVDDTLTASVPLELLGSPSAMRFQAVMEALDTPDPEDPLSYVGWADRVPDAEDEWLALGETAPAPTFALRSFYDVLDNKRKTLKAKDMRQRISEAYGDPPNAAAEAYLTRDEAVACVPKMGVTEECDLGSIFWYVYRETGDQTWFEVSVDALNFAVSNVVRQQGGDRATEKMYKGMFRDAAREQYGEEGPVPPTEE